MTENLEGIWQNQDVIRHCQRLSYSFRYWTGNDLFTPQPDNEKALSEALFFAPFVLVSHGTEADPIFNYGNAQALKLWEISWEDFTKMPSRYTAEPVNREERERLLKEGKKQGYLTGYRGVRISRMGRKFIISDAILWTVIDEHQKVWGQAATFPQWEFFD